VGQSHSHRRALRTVIRELLVRGGAALGLILGLLWALNRRAPPASASCKATGTPGNIGGCFSETLSATALPYVLAMGVGIVIGATIGWLVSKLLVGSLHGQRRGHAGRGVDDLLTRLPTDARWITARYDGTCRHCGASIGAGDRVLHRPRHTLCGACGTIEDLGSRQQEPSRV
jgi:hypothetical protein